MQRVVKSLGRDSRSGKAELEFSSESREFQAQSKELIRGQAAVSDREMPGETSAAS